MYRLWHFTRIMIDFWIFFFFGEFSMCLDFNSIIGIGYCISLRFVFIKRLLCRRKECGENNEFDTYPSESNSLIRIAQLRISTFFFVCCYSKQRTRLIFRIITSQLEVYSTLRHTLPRKGHLPFHWIKDIERSSSKLAILSRGDLVINCKYLEHGSEKQNFGILTFFPTFSPSWSVLCIPHTKNQKKFILSRKWSFFIWPIIFEKTLARMIFISLAVTKTQTIINTAWNYIARWTLFILITLKMRNVKF